MHPSGRLAAPPNIVPPRDPSSGLHVSSSRHVILSDRHAILRDRHAILSDGHVILSDGHVILSDRHVILSEAKDLSVTTPGRPDCSLPLKTT